MGLEHVPYIVMDFNQETLVFEHPLQVLQANQIEEVEAIFEQVQLAMKQEKYVVGYVSYESSPAFHTHYKVNATHSDFPLVWFGIYDKPSVVKPHQQQPYQVSEWRSSTDYGRYEDGIKQIHNAIASGDTYQVNYTIRFHSEFEGDDRSYYEHLKAAQNGNYSAYFNLGRYRILSVSPELFFRWDGETIVTKPMKGTAPRGIGIADEQQKEELAASEKNRAENLMIVDLLRNDISKIAAVGSVKVPKLFEIEPYPTVYQMTSTVEAKTKPNTTLFELFCAMFPCGSITGAPKISTMQIIDSLEDEPRHIYCGAIGLITPDQQVLFNVAIRTVLIDKETQQAVYGVGGGITWDSTVADEFEEVMTKSKVLSYRNE
ncbi:aminodeoxychorismate synthase component I [Paenibacillus assamensis]|uniref:aminodeoxychorismate synthase component I n=1 Tax=Paenibacillus assamensis TaxID=311244 RepID=UPI00041F6D4F|nr:aminodeoxychorismate synthase component I [Paenibacillus assamensis]